MNTTLRLALTTASVGVLALGLNAPALAAAQTFTDPDDVNHGVDLLRTRVNFRADGLRIVLTHDDIRKSPASGAGGAVYIDTDPSDKGPELVFVGGYFEGTDYSLLRTEGFGPSQWGNPVKGTYSMKLDYANDKTRMQIGNDVLQDVDKVRVAVKVSGERKDGTTAVDWLGKRRSFTPWVTQG